MSDTSSSAQQETPSQLLLRSVFSVWCAIGLIGFIVSFWKHGSIRILGVVCYVAVFVLAAYFLFGSRGAGSTPTTRRLGIQSLCLLWLGLLPMLLHISLH